MTSRNLLRSRPQPEAQTDVAPWIADLRSRSTKGAVPWRSLLGAFLVLLVLGLTVNSLLLLRLPGLGPVDSHSYVDALDRALDGQAAHSTDTMGPDSASLMRERGIHFPGQLHERRDSGLLDIYAEAHLTSYVHPPSYFFLTAGVVKAVQVFRADADWYVTGRLAGALWAALGGILLVALGLVWGAPVWPATSVAAWVTVLPQPVLNTAFITPGALTLAVSAAVLLGLSLWWQRRISWWALAPFGALTIAIKTNNAVLVPLALGAIVAFAIMGRARWRDSLSAGAAFVGGAAVAFLGWQAWADPVTYNYQNDIFAQPPSLSGLLDALQAPLGFNSASSMIRTMLIHQHALVIWSATIMTLLLIGATLFCLLRCGRHTVGRLAGLVALGTIATAGLLFFAFSLVRTGVVLPPAGRYALPSLAFVAWPLLLLAGHRVVWSTATVGTAVTLTGWLLL
ncbi:MAG: hypothetical protein KDC39_10690 [Actinobacteria bacterium]|nr:hypothetical protein [Actinomycetota bacterium]